MIRIRETGTDWYLCEVRGALFTTWVSERDKEHALFFPENNISSWLIALQEITRKKLEAVHV